MVDFDTLITSPGIFYESERKCSPEARGAKPFQHSNIYYDTFFSQNAAVSSKKGCLKNVGNVGPLGTLHFVSDITLYNTARHWLMTLKLVVYTFTYHMRHSL